ncbi:MAG: hypothetical protein WA051_01970 [Minisyncoccia bacterium]
MYTPNYNNAMMQNEPQEGGSMGSLIGIILIVVVIVLGGIYFWGKKTNNQIPANTDTQSIEKDLNSIDTTGGDSVKAIDQSLQGN